MLHRALMLSFVAAGCAHTISNEERLDQATESTAVSGPLKELGKLDCAITSDDVKQAHDETLPALTRQQHFEFALTDLQGRVKRFDEVFAQNPDLLYAGNGPELQRSRDRCAAALTRLEAEKPTFAAMTSGEAPAVAKPAATVDISTSTFADDPTPAGKSKAAKKAWAKKKRLANAKKKMPRVQIVAAAARE